MPRNIITSSFKNIPRGFLFVAMLFVLTECFLYANRAELTDDYWNKFLINESELIKLEDDFDYLVIGNSLQKSGIDPGQVGDGLLNLGLPGSKPMEHYLLLKRYLENQEPPKVLFLYVDPENVRDSLLVILRYFVNVPEFASIFRDLTWRERGCFLMRYWVSLDERKVGLTKRDEYYYSNKTFIEEMIRNRGFMPAPRSEVILEPDHFAETSDRDQQNVAITEKDMAYLDKLMKLASDNNIKVVFLGFLVPKELHDIFEESGFNKECLIFRKVLEHKYPDADFVADPILYLDNAYFGDRSHLNEAGTAAYSRYFKTQAFEPYSTGVE